MAQIVLFDGDYGLVADDEMEHGFIRVGPHHTWFMTLETYQRLQYLEVMEATGEWLRILGPGIHELADEYKPDVG